MFILPIKSANNKLLIDNKNHCQSNFVPTFKSTSAGAPLKNLKNITDPYFGEKLIPITECLNYEKVLDTKTTVKQAVKALNKYRPNMQVVERAVFDTFKKAAEGSCRIQFNDILKMLYNKALIRLKIEEFLVLDEIDKLSMNLEPETTFQVRAKTTHCRQVILNDDPNDRFKRKTVIDSIDEINPKDGEEKVLDVLKKRANYLPSSNTSMNAFIVKYASRSHEEISKRLIRASSQSIEHIKPDSLGGENVLDNFMLASSAANSLRGNMPLPDFIEMFPHIVKNCQKYIEDIITVIHNGGLKGHQKYPYDVAKTLNRESKGLIQLNLANYKYSESEATKLETRTKFRRK